MALHRLSTAHHVAAPTVAALRAFCFAAHCLAAILLRSAASSRALFAASSLERRSRSFSLTKLDSRLKISLPRIFCSRISSALTELPRTLPAEVDVARDKPAVDGESVELARPREAEEVAVDPVMLGRLDMPGPMVE